MKGLNDKIKKSKEVIKEALSRWSPDIGIAFSGGKDSLAILGLLREMYGRVSLPVLFNDTGVLFNETVDYVKGLAELWDMEMVLAKPVFYHAQIKGERERCCWALKIEPSEWAMKMGGWRACLVGIRWDEHESRSDEDYFSERENGIWRVHPILHWTEADIWAFIRSRGLRANPLYAKGYRSIGCEPCTTPASEDEAERAGRAQDKEQIMRQLRGLGYW